MSAKELIYNIINEHCNFKIMLCASCNKAKELELHLPDCISCGYNQRMTCKLLFLITELYPKIPDCHKQHFIKELISGNKFTD